MLGQVVIIADGTISLLEEFEERRELVVGPVVDRKGVAKPDDIGDNIEGDGGEVKVEAGDDNLDPELRSLIITKSEASVGLKMRRKVRE